MRPTFLQARGNSHGATRGRKALQRPRPVTVTAGLPKMWDACAVPCLQYQQSGTNPTNFVLVSKMVESIVHAKARSSQRFSSSLRLCVLCVISLSSWPQQNPTNFERLTAANLPSIILLLPKICILFPFPLNDCVCLIALDSPGADCSLYRLPPPIVYPP